MFEFDRVTELKPVGVLDLLIHQCGLNFKPKPEPLVDPTRELQLEAMRSGSTCI